MGSARPARRNARRGGAVLAIAIGCLLAGCGSSDDREPARSAPWAAGAADTAVLALHRTAQGWNPSLGGGASGGRPYRFVTLPGAFTGVARALRVVDPRLRALVYKNVAQSVAGPVALTREMRSTGIDFREGLAGHPEWFLVDRRGARITRHFSPGETDYLMDVGNREYQRAFADAVVLQAREGGWDGVLLDDALPTLRYWLPSGDPADVARYPSDTAWQAAVREFLDTVGGALRSEGLVVIANVCCDLAYGVRRDWASLLDGTMDEGFLNPAAGRRAPLARVGGDAWNDWRAHLDAITTAEADGKYLLATTLGAADDLARARYGLATYLLAAGGYSSYEYHASDRHETWTRENERAARLGPPRSRYRKIGHVYRRDFANGLVLVNPTAGNGAERLDLGGEYTTADGSVVSAITLPAGDASILLRA